MTDYVIQGLIKRHAELAGEGRAIRARLAQVDTDLVHLASVIRQFDPECEVESIRPKRQAGPGKAYRGERSRLLLEVLREAGKPLTAAEIVRGMLLRHGVDPEDRLAVRKLAKPVDAALARQERRGVLAAAREPGRLVLWTVAG